MAKVFLSAGHGGSDPGAVAYGLKEKTINLNIMLACRDELKRHGVTVVCSRTKDENDPVGEEVREANKSGADVAASFHSNGGKGDGSESYYYPTSKAGKKLAELCEKHVKAIGQNSRGVKTKNLAFVRDTKMVAVLCECAFVDNNKDNDIIDTVAEQKKFGVAYAKAILEYLGIKYKNSGSTVSKPAKPKPKPSNKSFLVKVKVPDLTIRAGAGMNHKAVGHIKDRGTYTIVAVKYNGKTPWGKLKSGAGYISLNSKYVERL